MIFNDLNTALQFITEKSTILVGANKKRGIIINEEAQLDASQIRVASNNNISIAIVYGDIINKIRDTLESELLEFFNYYYLDEKPNQLIKLLGKDAEYFLLYFKHKNNKGNVAQLMGDNIKANSDKLTRKKHPTNVILHDMFNELTNSDKYVVADKILKILNKNDINVR